MDVFELKLKIYLLKDISQPDALNHIASFIDETLSADEELLEFHRTNRYKNYNFCSFYPPAQEGLYHKDNLYTIVLRTIDSKLADYFLRRLPNYNNNIMKGLTCEIKKIPFHPIEKVYSLTPVLLKDPAGYWKKHLSFPQFEERIKVNLIKKYNAYTAEKMQESFLLYNSIQFLNKVPIKVPYKEIHLLGDKLELQVADDKEAQQLIYMSLGTGLGESNARGYGFLNYQYYK